MRRNLLISILLFMQLGGPVLPIPMLSPLAGAAFAMDSSSGIQSIATRKVVSYFPELAQAKASLDPDHLAHLELDFRALFRKIKQTGAFRDGGDENEQIFWAYWENPDSRKEILSRELLLGSLKDFTVDMYLGMVLARALEKKSEQIQDYNARHTWLVRKLSGISGSLTLHNILHGTWWVVGGVVGTLGTAIYTGATLGTVMNLFNSSTAVLQNPAAQGLAARMAAIPAIQWGARKIESWARPTATAGINQEGSRDHQRMTALVDNLNRVLGREHSVQEGAAAWEHLLNGFSEMNLSWKSGFGDDLRNARDKLMDASFRMPMSFATSIATDQTLYEQERQGLDHLKETLPHRYGLGLFRIYELLDLDEELYEARRHPERKEAAERLARELKDKLKSMRSDGEQHLLKGPTRPEPPELNAQLRMLDERLGQILEHRKQMRQASISAGTKVASWFENDASFPELNRNLPEPLRDLVAEMRRRFGYDFYLAEERLNPHVIEAVRTLKLDPAQYRAGGSPAAAAHEGAPAAPAEAGAARGPANAKTAQPGCGIQALVGALRGTR